MTPTQDHLADATTGGLPGVLGSLLPRQAPMDVARAIGAVRLGIGVVGVLAPGAAVRRTARATVVADEAIPWLRLAAGRDVAMGLGLLLAARRGAAGTRGWVEAGALADALDVWSMARGRGLKRWVRVLGSLSAASAAAAGAAAARRLG